MFRRPKLTRQGKPENRISMMGMSGVGKTTLWGAIIAAAQQNAAYNTRFFTDIDASPGHPILKANSLFRAGRYPPKTDPKRAYRAEIWTKWVGFPGLPAKEVQVVVVEMGGERIRSIVDSYNVGGTGQMSTFSDGDVETIEEYILKSRNFIIVGDLSRCPLYSKWEEEIGDSEDPVFLDEDCRDIVQSIQQYKRSIEGAKYEPNFCILLHKYDKVRAEFTTRYGMDLLTPQGLDKFLAQGLPQTANKLAYMQNPKNIFLPVWVEAAPNSKDRMMMNPQTKMPFFAETNLIKSLEWIRTVA